MTVDAPGAVPNTSCGPGRGVGVLLVDQVPLLCEAMGRLVGQARGLRWLGAASTLYSAVVAAGRLRPEVVVIDSALDPRGDLARVVLAASPGAAVLTLVGESHRRSGDLAGMLGGGVHGLVLRSAEPAGMLQAIRQVHAERGYLDPALAAPACGTGRARAPGRVSGLSQRESQVLGLIADGLESHDIATRLSISTETVRAHNKHILAKLSARNRAHAVAIACRGGLPAEQQQPTPARTKPPECRPEPV